MSDEALPQEVEELVRSYIRSVAQLEALLFFHKRPGERFDAETLAARLYASKTETADALASLGRDGFLDVEAGIYAFAPRPELRAVADSLVLAYSRHLIPITHIIHNSPRRIQAFSDAFRIRKD
ncbi:DNA-binding GntR family transcriptional regulator [Bradyrhizobium sp. LB7.2]